MSSEEKRMQWSFNRFQSCIFQHSSFQIGLWNLCKFHLSDRGEHHPRVHRSSNGTDWISGIKIICMEFLQCDISWFFPFLKLTDATHKGQKQAHAVGRNWVKCKFDSLCAVWLHVTSKEYEADLSREAVSAPTPLRDKHHRHTKAPAVLHWLVSVDFIQTNCHDHDLPRQICSWRLSISPRNQMFPMRLTSYVKDGNFCIPPQTFV